MVWTVSEIASVPRLTLDMPPMTSMRCCPDKISHSYASIHRKDFASDDILATYTDCRQEATSLQLICRYNVLNLTKCQVSSSLIKPIWFFSKPSTVINISIHFYWKIITITQISFKRESAWFPGRFGRLEADRGPLLAD